MKILRNPLTLGSGALLIAGIAFSSVPIMILGALLLLASFGFLAAKAGQVVREADVTEDLSPESRTLLRPVKRLTDDIAATVEANKGSSAVVVIGVEAQHEAEGLLKQVADSLKVRDELKKALRAKFETEKAISQLTAQLASATEAEKVSVEGALAARKTELSHFAEVEANITLIDNSLRQAEAVLSEMKTRLAVSVTGEKAESGNDTELRDTIGRLKNLSVSYAEAEQTLREL